MQKIIISTLLCCFLLNVSAQNTCGYFTFQYNLTLRDATSGNNPWSIGIGTQVFLAKSKIKPTSELTADLYGYSDKVYITYTDGTPIGEVGSKINLFPGLSYCFVKNAFVSFSAGPSFIGKVYFGIKPSIGFLSSSQKWLVKISYINIYNREVREKEDFTSASVSIGAKIF